MAEVIWTEPALAQLDAVADTIALDKPEAAKAVVRRIFAATDQVGRFKKMGRKIPEFPRPDSRQLWLRPCWICYRIEDERVYILHVRRSERPLHLKDLKS